MGPLKKALFFISDNLLRFLVYAWATVTILVMTLANPAHVKNVIEDSGAYDKFVASVIAENKKSDEQSSIPLDDPVIEDIANKSFPPDDLQRESEKIIDALYSWLEGNSDTVTFRVDFSENKKLLGEELSRYAFANLTFNETCPTVIESFDPFTINCRPYGFDLVEGQRQFSEEIARSESFLGKTVFTEDDLPRNPEGQNVFEQYADAPMWYSWLKLAPWVLGGLTILASISFVEYLSNKRKGVARLGRTIMGNSLTLIATPFIFSYLIPQFTGDFSSPEAGITSEVILNDILNSIVDRFDSLMLWFGLWIFLIGAAVFVGERMTRPRSRYSTVEKRAGLISSNEKRKKSSPRGRLTAATLPLQSSETSVTKKPKSIKRNKRYRKLPL